MDARKILIALHEMNEIGWTTILKIVSYFTDLSALIHLSQQEWERIGITPRKADRIRNQLTDSFVESRLKAYKQQDIALVTIYDPIYPELLKQTSQPPWVLYCKGNLELLQKPQIAIVGTRVPTVYGKNVAQQFAASLAQLGFCIVSGLARGIDSSAHQGALEESGGTLAVLGCGVDIVYPAENRALYQAIFEKGLLVSEFPIGTKAQPGLFPLRNRIIAGISLGTVVVEAALRSGSLITASQAIDESRDVFAVPGPINSPKSMGVLALIKQGTAKMATGIEDIIEEYNYLPNIANNITLNKLAQENNDKLSLDEQRIVALLSREPMELDRLLELSQTTFGQIHTILLSLTLKKKINQLPGSVYSIR